MIKVLGIDPGLRVAGYGCIELNNGSCHPTLIEAGAITLDTKQSISYRLAQLFNDVTEVIEDLKPDLLAVETVFTHKKQVTTATILGHARGVILLAGQLAALPIIELAPAEIKKSVSGNGRATKAQIQQSIAIILRLQSPPEPPDVADALAIAFTAAVRQ